MGNITCMQFDDDDDLSAATFRSLESHCGFGDELYYTGTLRPHPPQQSSQRGHQQQRGAGIPFFPLDPRSNNVASDDDSDNETRYEPEQGESHQRCSRHKQEASHQRQLHQANPLPFFPLDPRANDIGSDADSDNDQTDPGLDRTARATQRRSSRQREQHVRQQQQKQKQQNQQQRSLRRNGITYETDSSRNGTFRSTRLDEHSSTRATSNRLQHNLYNHNASGRLGCTQTTTHSRRTMDSSKVNIAVMGVARAGKSRFIKTLHGMRAAALRGNRSRASSAFENCVLWELPPPANGIPIETYLQMQRLKEFDLVFVLFCDTIKEFDGALAQTLQRNRIPFFVIRSKTDQAISEGMDDGYKNEETIHIIKTHSRDELAKFNVRNKAIFCIASSPSKQKDYDMMALVMAFRATVARLGVRK